METQPPAVPVPAPAKSGLRKYGTLPVLGALALLAFVAPPLILRAFFIESFLIPSGGMIPTLFVGDHIFVQKLPHDVRRGDVVVFKYPLDPSFDYIQRVIAVGGDQVEVSADGNVILNGQALPREQVSDTCPFEAQEGESCQVWRESVDGRAYQVVKQPSVGPRSAGRIVVPRDAVYVLGDNRDNSSDSRVWGTVPVANIKGPALFVWWSADPHGRVRGDRVGARVR